MVVIKRVLALWLLCCGLCLAAPGVSFDLQRVGLADFCRVVFGEVLKRSYVLDNAVISDAELFSVVLRDLSLPAVDREARRVLRLRGYTVDDREGVVVVSRTEKREVESDDREIFVYRPRFRSVQYILSLSESLFKPGSFVGRRNTSPFTFNQISGGQGFVGSPVPGQMIPGQFGVVGGQFDQGLNQHLSIDQDVVVFNGVPADIARFKKIVSQVDTPTGEMLVKAVVLEVQRSSKEVSAVDFVTSVLKAGVGLNFSSGIDAGGLSAKFNLRGVDFSAVYSALSSDSRFKVLTSPRVRVKSDSSAKFTVGNETPILGSVSYDSNGKPIQNVEYKSSGVIFELKPKIRDSLSELHVMQQISSFVPTTNGVNSSPTLSKRELITDVLVTDGDLIVIGGLDDEKNGGSSVGLSFLPDWMRARSSEDGKTEIVLLLNVDKVQRDGLNSGI